MRLGAWNAKIICVLLTMGAAALVAHGADFRYIRAGNPDDAPAARTRPGFALMGGGDDLDEALTARLRLAGSG